MSKRRGNIEADENFLRSVALPKATDTYTVIAHGTIIDKVREELNKNGFTIDEEKYVATIDGEIALGKVYIKTEKDSDMGMIFTWWNSYNKRVKFGCAVGSFIYDNKASLIGSEGMSWIRKHTGTADEEANSIMEQLISHANMYFDKIIAEKNKMKEQPLSVEDYGCIMGALYFEHELVTPTQASAVIQERKKPTHTYKDKDTLWGLYKILMFGIEGMDITKWVKSQQKLHHMIMTEYAIKVELPETITMETADGQKIIAEVDPVHDISKGEPAVSIEPIVVDFSEEEKIDDTPQIAGIPNGDTISDTDDDEPSKEEAVRKTCEETHNKDLVDYWMKEHYIDKLSMSVNVANFNDWAPKAEATEKEVNHMPHGIDNNPEVVISESVDLDAEEDEDWDKLQKAGIIKPIVPSEDLNSEEETDGDPFANDPFAGEVTAEDLAAKHGVELSPEKIDAIKEEHGKEDETIVFEQPENDDLKLEMTESTKDVLNNIDEPVEIIDAPEEFVFPTDLDNPEKLNASLEVPQEVREQAEAIEKRMKELYGSVRPYHLDEDLVIIDETLECFSI